MEMPDETLGREKLGPFSNEELQRFLPHRAPFLMVDKILEVLLPAGFESGSRDPEIRELVGTRAVGIKNVTRNEWMFDGHFPGFAVFPGVLIVEAMAQVASFCLMPSVQTNPEDFPKKFRFFLAGLDGVRFKRPVLPGDTVKIQAELTKNKGPVCVFTVEATVDGNRCALGEIMANMAPIQTNNGGTT